jgi:hypothetical protein
MAKKIVSFINVIILFLSVYFVTTNVDGESFLSFTNFLNYFEYDFFLHTLYIIFYPIVITFFFSFFTTAVKKCSKTSDCPIDMCWDYILPKCLDRIRIQCSQKFPAVMQSVIMAVRSRSNGHDLSTNFLNIK